ncbi:NAD(P)-binding protein, partial [Artomyces pyxidatus]
SSQATSICNYIIDALRCTSRVPLQDIPNSLVSDNPTISSLCDFVMQLVARNHDQTHGLPAKAQSMVALLETYSRTFPTQSPHPYSTDPASFDEVVLLTGSTGRLGCHLLVQLLQKPSVTKVYALNRSASVSLQNRHRQVFEKWRLDADLLRSPKLELLEGDITRQDLQVGIIRGLLTSHLQLRGSVTSIVLNAWRLDFNIPLTSFEPLISSVRNFIDFALGCPRHVPPPILFTSSISVVLGRCTQASLSEVPITDPRMSVATGYSESKWVAESLLLRAMLETGLRVNMVRVGQLCGDSVSGGWNEKEWIAALMRGSQVLGAVPERDDTICWVPVDVAASALLEVVGCRHSVLHLVHPNPVEWSVFSESASSIFKVPSIPGTAWLARLQEAHRKSASDLGIRKDNPALKLFGFFSTTARRTLPSFDAERAVETSYSLRTAARLRREDVERWAAYWRDIGFLKA